MLTSDFDYHLPPELIASEPPVDRSASRMMVLHRDSGQIEHRRFRDIGQFISAEAYVPINWASHVDPETGRPVELPSAHYANEAKLVKPAPKSSRQMSTRF